MVKFKQIRVNCSVCQESININVPSDIIKDKTYFPFEYIDIHGSPKHALMLFLDKSFSVRDTIVYTDLKIAKEKKEEFRNMSIMTENEAFYMIYTNEKMRKIYDSLTKGPLDSEILFKIIKGDNGFQEEELKMMLVPFMKTSLVRNEWLKSTFHEVYFLVKDFSAYRIPPRNLMNYISKDSRFKKIYGTYLNEIKSFFKEYKEKFLNDLEFREKEILKSLEYHGIMKYKKIFHELRTKPVKMGDLEDMKDRIILEKLTQQGYVKEYEIQEGTYHLLLTDVRIKKYVPRYLAKDIKEKVNLKEIYNEAAIMHLDYLYDADKK